MQQVTRGDYLKDLITIYIDNNLQTSLTDLYTQFVFQCGDIQKFLTPAQVIKISFNEQESQLLKNINTCYLAGITAEGHKETFNGSLTFNTRGEVVFYEPPVSTVIPAATEVSCPCSGISSVFSNCTQPAIKAYFSINYIPTKLSELINDTDFQDSVQVAETVSIHNASTEAHPYIRSLIADTTEALTAEEAARIEADGILQGNINAEASIRASQTEALYGSIVAETTAREEAVSLAISTTEAYADSILSSATTAINTTIGDLDNLDTSVKSSVVNAINSEVTARENADNNLQGQIDGLAAASDVTDIVGTYAELQAYDTQHLNDNDIIKVLSDSTHDDQPSYYRFDKDTDTFSYVGSESASYTKAQSDSIFVTQTTEINGHALSSDINLTPSDIGALADSYATVISANTSAIAANTSAIASNTSIIAQHTTAIAGNTSDISTINGKIPTDASSSNKLVSASTLAASIANFANQDLSNLTSNGEARLHALKSYADEGELLTDADGLAFVEKYAHSTFDVSKFTVTGSPNITSDGIVYNPDSQWVISTGYIIDGSDDWDISIEFDVTDEMVAAGSVSWLFSSTGGDQQLCCYFSRNDNWIRSLVKVYNTDTSSVDTIALDTYNQEPLTAGQHVEFVIGYTKQTSTYYRNVYINGVLTYQNSVVSSYQLNTTTSPVVFGNYSTGFMANGFKGKANLKTLQIREGGVPVFSGNKTGIDTVKPDDYTVEGSPSLTPDGILSSCSADDFLQSIDTYSGNGINTIVLNAVCKMPSVAPLEDTTVVCFQFGYFALGYYYKASTSKVIFTFWYRYNWYPIQGAQVDFVPNAKYEMLGVSDVVNDITFAKARKIEQNTWLGQYQNVITNLDTECIDSKVIMGKTTISGVGNLTLGNVDLNTIKIYKNIDYSTIPYTYGSAPSDDVIKKALKTGDLVYQPCLKIPYTESKTGSKIVDSYYRNRVQDMAEQFGYANYYTLDEVNGNFTLPQVELYGLIGQRTLRDSYRNGINYWELYSNRDLEQGGSCTSGVEVTFARPFADTNYVLSVPYSAKSATAFTPTQTGDWIAKGKGVL